MFTMKYRKNYWPPYMKETELDLESNFCGTVRFNAKAKELENMNADEESGELFDLY